MSSRRSLVCCPFWVCSAAPYRTITGAYALKYSGGRWVFVPSFSVAVASFFVNIFLWKRLVPRVPPDSVAVSVKVNE